LPGGAFHSQWEVYAELNKNVFSKYKIQLVHMTVFSRFVITLLAKHIPNKLQTFIRYSQKNNTSSVFLKIFMQFVAVKEKI